MTTALEKLRDTVNSYRHQDMPLQSIKDDLNVLLDEVETVNGSSQPILFTSVPISSAQLLAINNTPVELLPAPGGRFYYVLHRVFAHYRFNTTPYTDPDGLLSYLVIGYGALAATYWQVSVFGSGHLVDTSNWLTKSEDAYIELTRGTGASAAWLASEIEDEPLMIAFSSSGAPLENGDGTVVMRLWYSLIDGAP